MSHWRWDDESLRRLKELRKDGLTMRQIGERLGCSWHTVSGKITALGTEIAPAGTFRWDDDATAMLRELWPTGLAVVRIAERIGCSKNSITGKADRLGLPRRPSPIKPRLAASDRRGQAAPRTTLPVSTTLAPERIRPDRAGPTCCWPLGEPRKPGFRFCGDRAVPGRPYCEAHVRSAYVRVTAA